jgi:hypothetical protein
MTTTIEEPKPITATTTKPLSPEEKIIRKHRPKNTEHQSEARELQQQRDRIQARYAAALSAPADREFTLAVQLDPASSRTLRDFEESKAREIATLHASMNQIANKATALNAKLSKEFAQILASAADKIVAQDKKAFEEHQCIEIFADSPLVSTMRKLVFRFQMAAQKTTTSADISGAPKVILSAFFDL